MAAPRAAFMKAFAELKRRRVFGAVAAYAVLAALLVELSGAIFEALLLPDWSARLFTIMLILGLPVVAVMSWFFDLSAAGIARTPETPEPRARERGGLDAALRRSRELPVPEAPVQRRQRTPPEKAGGTGGPAPDPERVRAAALGHVRHELRTPINGIIGYSEMLLEDVSENGLVEDLERIRTAGRKLLDRVDALLQPDRLAGDSPEELEAFAEQVRVDLRTPISAVVGYAELLMETCEEEGRDNLLPDLERILTSARRLLDLSEDIVSVATHDPGGQGPDGLAESSELTREVLSRIQPVASSGDRPDGEGRLLVVDDNETNRDLLSRQLARHGYVVSTAANGQEGLERLERESCDLILLDVIMPGMNGVEMLARLQADDRWADIPVIMLSSLDEVDSAVRCIEMGALDYVSKPVQPTLLEARIAAALEIRELRRREQVYRRRVDADRALIHRLLDGAVPPSLRDRVAEGGLDIVETYPEVSVIRGIIPGVRSGAVSPDRVHELASALGRFETLARSRDMDICLWRPDGFTAAATGAGHAGQVAELALAARDAFDDAPAFGLHTGEAVGGILGRERPRFELWGEGVDTAEALARLARPGEVLVSPAAQGKLRESYGLEPRGVREVAGTQIRIQALVASRPDPARGAAAG